MADLSKELNKELSKDFAYCEDALGRAENAIGNLPSAQPQKRTEERMETHTCDLIDRQAAIDALDGEITVTGRANAEAVRGYANLVCDRIKRLPSAQPEPKWIPCRESNGNIHPYSELLHESKGILVTYKTRTGRRYVKQVLCNHGRVEKILLGDIVAWLPLPTPYREDEEE